MPKNSEKSEKPEVKRVSEHETVKIGTKPAMNYLLATTTLFAQGAKSVTLVARGKSISTAVNVHEAMKRKMKIKKAEVEMDTDIVKDQKTRRDVRVSTIEIRLEPE